MSNSLKDQLLALGLARSKPKPEPKKSQHVISKPAKANKNSKEISLDQAYRIRIREERLEKERTLELKRKQESQRREINQKIQALIRECAIRDPGAENKRNFIYKGRIRSVLATREQIN
ncbi:MAG: DUF2058 family protein, partial [Lysobacterales bacterium]